MMEQFVITTLIFVFLVTLFGSITSDEKIDRFLMQILELFVFFILSIIFYEWMCSDNVKPIDVYRGNTELRINVETENGDTVRCDSIVVFKDINKK